MQQAIDDWYEKQRKENPGGMGNPMFNVRDVKTCASGRMDHHVTRTILYEI